MAGERYASVKLETDLIEHGQTISLWLSGAYHTFTAVSLQGNPPLPPRGYYILDPTYTDNVTQLRLAVIAEIQALGLPYVVSSELPGASNGGLTTLTVQATAYDPFLNFLATLVGRPNGAIVDLVRLDTIRPVRVAVSTTAATRFGAADGAMALVASNGNDGVYSYRWADGPLTATRAQVVAGTYTCTVTDTSGANTTVVVVVESDARLDVLVNRTANNVTLVPSGGVPPYAYAWTDGPTTATRLALALGTYTCTVTDARGARQAVSVVVDPYRFYWSKNPVTLALDAGEAYRLDPGTKPDLRFVCEVWVEEAYRTGTFVLVGGTQEQPADRFGRTVFDAQALLDSYLREHLPALNQASASRADSLFRRFYFRYAEKYGTPPVAAALSNQAEHYVVLGGLDFYEAPADTWFRSYQAGAKPFLTWEPAEKAVLAMQPEYLYFMADDFALTDFELRVDVHYADGARAQLRRWATDQVQRFEVFCLPVGFLALGLGSSGPPVTSWEVWVSDAAGVAQTERRRYVLNTDYVARPRFFLYTNSLGGTGTFCCTGDAKAALDVKAEEAERPLGAGYDPLLGDTLTLDRSGVPTLSVSSGKLKRAQLIAAQDFLLSSRVTLQAGNAYFPGRVKAKATPLVDEGPGELSNLAFDFLLPRQRQFTPRLPATSAGRAVVPVRGGEGAQP